MFEVDLHIPNKANNKAIIEAVERVCTGNRLACSLKGTLASYPGCVHWHYKKDNQKGTLEITWWEDKNRLWFKVSNGRRGEWIDESLPRLKKEIESSFNK